MVGAVGCQISMYVDSLEELLAVFLRWYKQVTTLCWILVLMNIEWAVLRLINCGTRNLPRNNCIIFKKSLGNFALKSKNIFFGA